MDKILIKDLAVRCIIGVGSDERRDKQDVLINVVLHADLSKAASTDKFEDAVDYGAVKKPILAEVEVSQYCLIEALATRVTEICLENKNVHKVQVTVEKPSALRFARSVGVEMTREQTG